MIYGFTQLMNERLRITFMVNGKSEFPSRQFLKLGNELMTTVQIVS